MYILLLKTPLAHELVIIITLLFGFFARLLALRFRLGLPSSFIHLNTDDAGMLCCCKKVINFRSRHPEIVRQCVQHALRPRGQRLPGLHITSQQGFPLFIGQGAKCLLGQRDAQCVNQRRKGCWRVNSNLCQICCALSEEMPAAAAICSGVIVSQENRCVIQRYQ